MAEASEFRPLPLGSRPYDWLFVAGFAFFAFFAFSSVASDALHALGLFDGDNFLARANHDYIVAAGDEFLRADHIYTRYNTAIRGFIFGPFYVALVYAFIKGRAWIRVPAFIYVGAMLHGMFEHTYWEYVVGPPPTHPAVFWAFNGPYALLPILLAIRMWKADPFAEPASSES